MFAPEMALVYLFCPFVFLLYLGKRSSSAGHLCSLKGYLGGWQHDASPWRFWRCPLQIQGGSQHRAWKPPAVEQHWDVLLWEEEVCSSKYLVSFCFSAVANFMQEQDSSWGRDRRCVLSGLCYSTLVPFFEGYQLPEAGKLLGSLWLEDLVQFGVSPPHDAAVCIGLPLPQRSHQLPAQDGRAVYATCRYATLHYQLRWISSLGGGSIEETESLGWSQQILDKALLRRRSPVGHWQVQSLNRLVVLCGE